MKLHKPEIDGTGYLLFELIIHLLLDNAIFLYFLCIFSSLALCRIVSPFNKYSEEDDRRKFVSRDFLEHRGNK